jgi:DNA polymerase-3 subunit epsilon
MIITVIDTETTGFDMLNHEVIELAVLRIDTKNNKYKELDYFESKIVPQNIERAAPQALKVNGYTEEAWRSAATFPSVAPILTKFIENSDLHLGQNLIFDYRFISKAYNQHNIELPKFKSYVDTKLMADALVYDKKLQRSGLDFLCEHYKIKSVGRAHTALTDCRRTIKLYQKLLKEIKPTVLEFSKPYDPYEGRDAKKKEV